MARTRQPLLVAGVTVVVLLCAATSVVLKIDRAVAWISSTSLRLDHRIQKKKQKQMQSRWTRAFVPTEQQPRTQESKSTAVIVSAFDGSSSSSSSNTERIIPETQPKDDIDPTVLEEQFLSQSDALDSLLSGVSGDENPIATIFPEPQLSKENTSSESNDPAVPYFLKPVPFFLQSTTCKKAKTIPAGQNYFLEAEARSGTLRDTSVAEVRLSGKRRAAATIDRSVYEINRNLVNVLYAAISFFYPTSSSSSPSPPQQTMDATSSLLSPLLGTEYNEPLEQGVQPSAEVVLRFEIFYIFETVARIPYFAYLSVLHLRETLGDRGILPEKGATRKIQHHNHQQRTETMRTHYAQADNELHHLLIMEALGGNSRGIDRFVAHTMAFFYYWFVVLVFLWNEQVAYHLNEVVEDHAYKIYDEFLAIHEDELRALPVPEIARKYYEVDYRNNPHLFEAFCAVSKSSGTNSEVSSFRRGDRPHELNSLYDVFKNVRDDEREHWMALCNLVQYDDLDAADEANVRSTEARDN